MQISMGIKIVKKGYYTTKSSLIRDAIRRLLQKRPRLIFIAIRSDISTLNDLTPMNLFDDIEV